MCADHAKDRGVCTACRCMCQPVHVSAWPLTQPSSKQGILTCLGGKIALPILHTMQLCSHSDTEGSVRGGALPDLTLSGGVPSSMGFSCPWGLSTSALGSGQQAPLGSPASPLTAPWHQTTQDVP